MEKNNQQPNAAQEQNENPLKPRFDHCFRCKYFSPCYKNGDAPAYLEPSCASPHQ